MTNAGPASAVLGGGGEMGALMRSIDWSRTAVGPVERWPQSLRTALSILLETGFPMYIAWGREFTQFYNDGYRPILGSTKHPSAMGISTRETFAEIWHIIGPMFEGVLEGKATTVVDFLLPLDRHGFTEECYFIFSYSPIRDEGGNVGGVLVTVTETTQRVLGERRLQTTQARIDAQLVRAKLRSLEEAHAMQLADVFAHAPVGVALLRGPEHTFEFANERYLELVGGRPLLGKPIRQALPELAGQGIFELLDEVYASGKPHIGHSVPVQIRRRGERPEETFFDFAYQPLRDERGRTQGIAVTAMDVTELSVARREAEAANRAKDEFLAMLGHELRNPLAPIVTALQLMRMRGVTDAERERTIIERQVRHLMTLVDDLLDVSRIARGKVQLKREPLDFADVVARAIEMTSPAIDERRHVLSVEVPRGLVVSGDDSRLAQVLTNLLANAAKYTDPGGQLRIRAEAQGATLLAAIADSGRGIDPEILPRIFDLFSQERQEIDRSQGGLGLGLAIVKSLIEAHGGSVEARSEGKGRGAEFLIRLPLAAAPSAVAPPSRTDDRLGERRPGLRVLIVDDNVDAAELLAEALRALGYVTRSASDGPSAIEVAARFEPNVALIDLGLPVMDGFEVARALKGLPGLERLALVAITGYGQANDQHRTRAAGFDEHMVKPISIEHLQAWLRLQRAEPRATGADDAPAA